MVTARSIWLLFCCLSAMSMAFAENAKPCGAHSQDPIAADRPQITSSSIVVPCGSLQVENGFQETSNAGQRTFDLPETSLRLGVAGKTELRFGVPDYSWNDQTASGVATGLGDLNLGLKQQLGPTRGGFDVSIIPTLSLPTGAKAISSHGYDPSVQIPWSCPLGKSWTVAGMFSALWPTQGAGQGRGQGAGRGGRRNLTGQASVYFDRQVTQSLDAFIEYSGSFPQRGSPQHVLDFGTAYKISPRQQLDFHCGLGLSAAAPGSEIGIGYSARFQIFGSK